VRAHWDGVLEPYFLSISLNIPPTVKWSRDFMLALYSYRVVNGRARVCIYVKRVVVDYDKG